MVSVFPLSEPNMLGFTLDGEVNDDNLRKLLIAVEAKVLTHGHIRLLGNIKSVGGFQGFQTFWRLLKSKGELWDKIEKYAILTDHGWLATITGSIDWLTPRMDIKTFSLAEGELAHAWLKIDPAEKPAEAVKKFDLGDKRLLGLAIVDKMEVSDYDRINSLIDEQALEFGQARIMLEVVYTGFSGQALLEDLKASIKNYSKVERIAIVGDQSWLKTTVKLGDLLTPGLDLAAFNTVERKRAISWLG
jgi:hypothetical protein